MTDKQTSLMPAIDDGLRHVLTQQTPPDAIKKRKGKGGKTFSYVEHAWVTSQLNSAFNWGWSWEIVEWQILPSLADATEVFTLGRLTVHTPQGDIVKMQFGTQAVKRDRQGNVLSLGDDLKAASSDGLKKAASLLGLALDLYKTDAPPDDDDGHTLANDPMTAFWAATRAKGMTQAEGAALLQKHKGNPDRALKELAQPVNQPPVDGNGKTPKAAFFTRVAREIKYFSNAEAIADALRELGYTEYDEAKDAEMFEKLQTYANAAANKEAA